MHRHRLSTAGLLVAASLLGACGAGSTSTAGSAGDPSAADRPSQTPTTSPTSTTSDQVPGATDAATTPALADADLAAANVNELGRIPVLQWHEIQDVNGRWANRLDTFRAQLDELHARGYRPISVPEFIEGDIDLPAGLSPVLLTFDDSYREHLFLDADGEPHPDSVVGILEAMHEQDPTWRPLANFAFYWPYPFREVDRDVIEAKLRYLVEHGYDLSNHTYAHDNLARMTDDEVVANLARAERELAEVVGDDYRVRSITLTQGIWPANPDLAMAGEADGFAYRHDVAFEVGFQPTRSPFHAAYDPRSVQRVQAWLPEFRRWMDWLDEEPTRRYVSDGDPGTVAFPADFAEVLGDVRGRRPRPYRGEPSPSAHLPATCVGVDDGEPVPCHAPGEPLPEDR